MHDMIIDHVEVTNIENYTPLVFYIGDPMWSCQAWHVARSLARHHDRLTCLTTRQMKLLKLQYQHSTGGSYVEKPAETIVYGIRPASY